MTYNSILMDTNVHELQIVEFYLDETITEEFDEIPAHIKVIKEDGREPVYRSYYGVNVSKVTEIIQLPRVTPLPEIQNQAILGAFNLRSQIIPLIDLCTWFDKEHPNDETTYKVIVTEFNKTTSGFKVSGLNRIHRVSWEEVTPPGVHISMFSHGSISGIIRLEGRIIYLLDLEKIMTGLNPSLGLMFESEYKVDNTKKYKVLVVDDSISIREIMANMLTQAGFDVDTAANGFEALNKLYEYKILSEEDKRPISDYVEIVITDIEMPVKDGTSLCKDIKADNHLKELPVILFSSLNNNKSLIDMDAVGADAQINKPDMSLLVNTVHDLLKNKEANC